MRDAWAPDRSRRTHAAERSLALSLYERLTVALLFAAPMLGLVLIDGARVGSRAAIGLLALMGSLLAFLRPARPEERNAVLPPAAAPLAWLLLYYLLWMLAAPVRQPARQEGLWLFSIVIPYGAWCLLGGRENRWRWVLGGMLLWVSLLAWYALIHYARGAPGVLYLPRPEGYLLQATGPLMDPDAFAHLLAMLSCVAVAVLLVPSAGVPMKLVAGYSLVLFLPSLFLTYSRGGWLGLAAGGMTTLGLVLWRRRRRWVWPVLAVALLGLGAVATAGWFFPPLFRERLLHAPADAGRIALWRDTLAMVADRPWWGHGPGSFRWAFPPFRSHFLPPGGPPYAPNEYVHLAAETGWVGLALFLSALVVLLVHLVQRFRGARRERDAALLAGVLGAWAVALVYAAFHSNLRVMAHGQVLALLTGLVAALARTSRGTRPRRLSAAAWRLRSLALSLLILAVSAGWVVSLASDLWWRRGEAALERLDYDEALRSFRKAAAWDPAHGEAWLRAGDVYLGWSFWARDPDRRALKAEQALVLYARAAARNPLHTEVDYARSRALALLGREEEAEACLLAAIERVPTDSFLLTQLGLFYRRAGRIRDAREVFSRAARLDGADPVVRANLRWLENTLREGREEP